LKYCIAAAGHSCPFNSCYILHLSAGLNLKKISLVLLVLIYGLKSLGQNFSDSTAKELKPVHLTGKREKDSETGFTSQSVNKRIIELTNSENVADALQVVPGVVVKDYGGVGGLKTVSLRSLGAEHTVILFDNIKMSDVQTGQTDLGRFSVHNIDEIVVYKGHPSKDGQIASAYAAASALNMLTARDLNDTAGTVQGSVSLASFRYISPSLSFKTPFRKSLFVFDAVGRYTAGDYPFTYRNGEHKIYGRRANSDLRDLRITTDFVTNIKAAKLLVKAYLNGGERGLPGAIVLYASQSDARLSQNDKFIQLELNRKYGNKNGWKIYSKYSHSYLRYYDPSFLNSKGFLENRYKQQEYFLSVAGYYKFKFCKINLATDGILNSLSSPGWIISDPLRFSSVSAAAFSVSLKRITADADLVNTFIIDEHGAERKKINKLTPAAALGYSFLRNRIALKASYKKSFRMPTFNDLYYNFSGNTLLRPETTEMYNISVSYGQDRLWFLDYLILKTDVFHLNVNDKIIAVPTQNLFVWSMRNIGKVKTDGIELSADTEIPVNKKISNSITLSYTYQSARDVSDKNSEVYNHQIAYTPWETASLVYGIEIQKVRFGYSLMFSGYRYALGQNIQANYLDEFYLHDLSVSYDFRMRKNAFRIKMEVNNLTDFQYQVIKSYPMPGRMFRIKIEYKYA
jgi:vitamin B12 transporter